MSFSEKRIDVSFAMANGEFAGGGNQHSVSGLRVMCHITVTGGPTQSQMEMAIFGLPLSVMNQLSTVGTDYARQYKNGVTVTAGDDDSGMALVFDGVIYSAYVDGQAQPQMSLRVAAMPGSFHMVQPAEPISLSGPQDAAGIMGQLAGQMGLAFENAGVDAKIVNPYYGGTPWSQMLAVARAGGFNVVVDRGKMTIIPPDKTRSGGAYLVSPETGMVGYPGFNQNNVLVYALFNPAVQFGGEIEVRSQLTSANGLWKVNRLEYELEAQVPGGKWFMLMEGVQIGPTPA